MAFVPWAMALPFAIMAFGIKETTVKGFGVPEKISGFLVECRIFICEQVGEPRHKAVMRLEHPKILLLFGGQPGRGDNLSVKGLPPAVFGEGDTRFFRTAENGAAFFGVAPEFYDFSFHRCVFRG